MVRGSEQCAFYVQYNFSDPANMSQGLFREFALRHSNVAGVQLARANKVEAKTPCNAKPNYISPMHMARVHSFIIVNDSNIRM